MGIDVTQWRVRIGTFCQSARLKSFLPVLEIGKITIAIRIVLFLLLVVHGVESNPGPSDVGERSCSKMRQCRGLGVDKELRKASDDGRLLIDEADIHETVKIRPIAGLLQNDIVSHETSTIKPESQSQHNSQLHSQPQPLNLLDQQNRTESLSQPQSHSQPLYLHDPQKLPESESLSQLQSHSQPINLPEDQNLPESLVQLQSHSQPQYMPDPQKRSETLSQLQSHSQPLYLSDPQKRSESESLSQPQSHSQPLYLPDPQKRPESESLSQLQSHSQPLNLPDLQNRSESQSQPKPHSQPLYLHDPQNLVQCQSQLHFHTQSQLQPNSPPLSQPQYLSYPHSNPQPQEISHCQLMCQTHLPSQPLSNYQAHPHSQSQPQLQHLPHPHALCQAHPHSQLLYQSHIRVPSELQSLLLCQYQLQSQSLCTSQESIMNVWNSSMSSELQQLKELVDSLKSENVSLNRRVEDLETFKERVTKADKFQGTDSVGEDRTGRQEKNPKSRNTEKANAADDYANMNQGVRHLQCKDDISQDLSSRAPVDEEGEQEGRTEPNNCSLSDNREEDDDADEYSSDEVVNSIADKMLSSDNMELPLVEDLKGLIDNGVKSNVLKTVGQHTDVTKNILMKSHTSGMDTDLITKGTGQSKTTLLEELCNMFMNSKLCDKGSSDKKKWYLNWHSGHFPPRDNNCIVSATPFNVSFRTVPLPPRSFIALNNNMYQYERVRLASFSTYGGSGFGVKFAKAGFVFDPATNMVVCPWCKVFVYNDVNINNMHLSDCVILQINIPFHNVPSPSVPAPRRRDCRQVGCVNVPPAPVQMPNRQSIGRSGSRIRSEPTPVSPVAGKNGVSSQEHTMRGSTDPRSCLDSHQSTLPVTIGMPNQTDSFKHAIPSTRTFNGTYQSSVHSCNTRNSTCSRDVTGSLNQCHQSASEHNSTVPSGSSKRADYSTDSTHLVFPEYSYRGNGNTWGSCPCTYDPEQVTADAENKDTRRDKTRRGNSSNGSKAKSIDVENNILCKVCQEGAVCVVFLPCNHMVTCQNCALAIRKCIICRTHIKATKKAFTD